MKSIITIVGFLIGVAFGWFVAAPALDSAIARYSLVLDTDKSVRSLRARVEQNEKTISRLCQHLGFWPIQTPDGGLSCGVEGKRLDPQEDGKQL